MSRDLSGIQPSRLRPTADLNITPMIDVLLVLLVIFMVSLPLTQHSLDTNLPAQTQAKNAEPPPGQIVVEVSADAGISINHQVVTLADLEGRLRAIFEHRLVKTLFIDGHASLRYGQIVAVIDAAKGAGVDRVGIITTGMRKGAANAS